MNQKERWRIQTANRIVDYLAQRLALARIWNQHYSSHEGSRMQLADPAKLLDTFMLSPLMVLEPDCDETYRDNRLYLDSLSPIMKEVLCWYIEMESVRYMGEWKDGVFIGEPR